MGWLTGGDWAVIAAILVKRNVDDVGVVEIVERKTFSRLGLNPSCHERVVSSTHVLVGKKGHA